MSDCLFCRIVAGEIPSEEVLSGPTLYAFRDISPAAPTHVLVVPREHIASAADLGIGHSGLLGEMIRAANEVAARDGIAEGGYRLVFNVGDDAGNQVPHLHLHVIGGRRLGWPPG